MFHQIKTSLYKARNRSSPSASRTFDDINIEGLWSKTLNGEQFVFNNWKYPTFESLKQLSTSDNDHLFVGGTLKSWAKPFYQLYSVHSVNSELSTKFITW